MEKRRGKNGISYREKVYVDGKTITKTFKRKSDALSWKRNFLLEQQRKEALGLEHIESIDFESFSKQWLEIKKNQGIAPKTVSEYCSIIKNYLFPYAKKSSLERINQATAQKVIQKARRNNLCPARINKILVIFKQILNDAVNLNFLVKNPLTGMKKIKVKPRSLTYWLPHEIDKFLSANVDDPHYPVFILALNTGMRRGELMGLCWDKVDLEKRRIEISRIRDRYGLKDTTKTGVIRYISLNDSAYKVLNETAKEKNSEQFVFAYRDGTLPNPNHLSNRPFKNAIEKAEVRRIRFHDLRTTYASNFVMAGGDIFALSKILGHSSVEMTAQKYAALHPSFMKDVMQTVQFEAKAKPKEERALSLVL